MFNFSITNTEEARRAYRVLSRFDNDDYGRDGSVLELAIEIKRAVRKWSHNNNLLHDVGMGFMVERRIVKEYGIDGFIELVSIPDTFDTAESANEFFMDFIYQRCRPSMYDCTGQTFTSWYHLFKRNGKFFAYHNISVDV